MLQEHKDDENDAAQYTKLLMKHLDESEEVPSDKTIKKAKKLYQQLSYISVEDLFRTFAT